MFSDLNPLMQTLRRILIQDRHGLLADNWAGIHRSIHKMHTASGDFNAMLECLFPCVQTWK